VADTVEKERRDRVRIKLAGSMLTACGYALLAGAAWEPLSKGQGIDGRGLIALAVGLSMHAAALYIAPRGEPK
jgi:hypothetical protein